MTAAALPSHPHPIDEHGFTVEDLYAIPDDGMRCELIEGSIIMSPSATGGHNLIACWIVIALEDAKPTDDYFATTDVSARIDNHNEPRPDLAVYRADYFEESPFPIRQALLVGEVISPNSALRDTETKRALYARAGVPSYWIIVPSDDKPTIALAELVLDPATGKYDYVTHYTTDVFRTERPWPVEIDLPALTARRARWFRPKR